MKKPINSPKNNRPRMTGMWICLCMAISSGIIYFIIKQLENDGLYMINRYLSYIMIGLSYGCGFLALMLFLRKKITDRFIRRMVTILCIVGITTVGATVVQRLAYLPYLHAYVENAGNKLAIICNLTVDPEVSDRLNAASAQFMADAEAAAAAAQAAGEPIQEVPNTVTGTDLLTTYSAYPVKYKFFYDTNTNVDGLVYTLFGATSAELKVEWPQENVCRLYAVGAEAEGESVTTIE